ncbi:hypothetical protein L198_04417 [Cryptococcus wingfieldii CBS 7118]|uniref:Uncharacterized protein n=1 Tax=Cryptococcus wingfieldii CBS 7118 TaxID=1295528 RepID=A0A1E3J4L8_9TREE|nr:hypothetical protein L198_04417 [Cryptococcus wingfieldii CBS 7118]ODN95799.1 hypothetical protein L198_04417 [Cryptococcus wingfieldii CBS 7118]
MTYNLYGYPPPDASPYAYGYAYPPPPPTLNPWRDNPQGFVRDWVELDTNSDNIRPNHISKVEQWTKHPDWLKVIMSVLKDRLGCEWPQNYKAIMYLEKVPEAELAGVHDDLKKIVDAGDSLRGHEHFKEQAKALYEKAKVQKKKADVAAEKKKYEEMMKKFGGMPYSGWAGWAGAPPVAGAYPGGQQQYMALYQRPSPYGYYPYPP